MLIGSSHSTIGTVCYAMVKQLQLQYMDRHASPRNGTVLSLGGTGPSRNQRGRAGPGWAGRATQEAGVVTVEEIPELVHPPPLQACT